MFSCMLFVVGYDLIYEKNCHKVPTFEGDFYAFMSIFLNIVASAQKKLHKVEKIL